MSSLYGLLAFLNWNHDWNSFHFPEELLDKACLQIRELGVDMIRTDIVWSDVHAGADQYDFIRYDRLVSKLSEHGIKALVVLHYNKVRLDVDGRELWNRPPDSFEEFARYVAATVRRYKDKIHAWEIWNEPNHSAYWAVPQEQLKPYCRLLRLSYEAAKNVDPSCLVINGGLTGDVVADVGQFYANGGGKITDKLNIHTFLDPTTEDSLHQFKRIINGVRNLMIHHGDRAKRIWITEMGCPGVVDPNAAKPWWIGRNTSETEQAQWVETIYTMARNHPSIEKLFWAFYRDTGDFFKDGVDYFGLVGEDFAPKSAFYRLKTLIRASNSVNGKQA